MNAEILVVEDDPVLGPITQEVLTENGHCVELVSSIDAAFERTVERTDIELILLDLQLGADRGEALIERLRGAKIKIPPVVIFSALPTPDLLLAARRVDAIGILQKPTQPSTMLAIVERAVRNKRT
jgi:DNA-binding response OmpR family regulator